MPEPSDPSLRQHIEAMERPLADARALYLAARYQEALEQTTALVDQAEVIAFPHLIARTSVLHARVLTALSQYQGALERLLLGLAHADRAGDDNLRSDILLEAMIVASVRLQDFPLAEDLIARADAVIERIGSPLGQRTLFLTWHAAFLQRKGDYKAALAVAADAVSAAREHGNDTRLAVAIAYYAELLSSNNRHREALPVLEEAIEKARRHMGESHPTIADLLHAQANVYSRIGDYRRTVELIQENLEIRQNAYGDVHSAVAESYHNLSNALRRLGRREEALAAAQRALEIRTAIWRPDHPMVGFSHRVVGIAHHALGQYELALEHVQRAAETSRAISDTHPYLARDEFWLGKIALAMNHLDGAERHFREVVRIDRARLGPSEGDKASHHTALASVDLAREKPRAVLRHIERAEALVGEDDGDTQGEATFLRAQALWMLGQHQEARAAALHAIELYQSTPSGEAEEVEKIHGWLAERTAPAAPSPP